MDIAQQILIRAEEAARALHPDLPNYTQAGFFRARRGRTSYIKTHNIILGYGQLVAEIADDDETLRAVRWKLGDGVHTWDELPDIPGPEYAFCGCEASIWPRKSTEKKPRRKIVYRKYRCYKAKENTE